jgi:hypothetical protein
MVTRATATTLATDRMTTLAMGRAITLDMDRAATAVVVTMTSMAADTKC